MRQDRPAIQQAVLAVDVGVGFPARVEHFLDESLFRDLLVEVRLHPQAELAGQRDRCRRSGELTESANLSVTISRAPKSRASCSVSRRQAGSSVRRQSGQFMFISTGPSCQESGNTSRAIRAAAVWTVMYAAPLIGIGFCSRPLAATLPN